MLSIQRKLGAKIRRLRAQRGWSQEEFADRCGLHRAYIGAVERGEQNLTISSLYTISRTLHVTISYLFREIA